MTSRPGASGWRRLAVYLGLIGSPRYGHVDARLAEDVRALWQEVADLRQRIERLEHGRA